MYSFTMLIKIIIMNVLSVVAYCCHLNNVEVHSVLQKGEPLVIKVSGCLERKSFMDGEKTRNVIEIDINRQDIPRLRKDEIRHMIHLRKLTIRNSNLKTIDPDVFRNVDNMDTVEFISNKLNTVRDGVFNYQDFKNVSLFDNEINSMDDLAFSEMKHLKNLNMSYNKLKTFKGSWFYVVPALTSIDFQHNEIERLPAKAFGNITNVTNIYLNHNNILSIENKAFEGLKLLKELNLKYNLLKTINTNSFPKSIKINLLHINANRLNFLSKSLFDKVSTKTISLDGNPWNCFCYRSMQRLLEQKGIQIMFSSECRDVNVPICAVASAIDCKEEIDDDVTNYYYTQIQVPERNSTCTRYLRQ